jgi:hypothetical protein
LSRCSKRLGSQEFNAVQLRKLWIEGHRFAAPACDAEVMYKCIRNFYRFVADGGGNETQRFELDSVRRQKCQERIANRFSGLLVGRPHQTSLQTTGRET